MSRQLSAEHILFGDKTANALRVSSEMKAVLDEMFKSETFPARLCDEIIKNAQLASILSREKFEKLYMRFEHEFGLFFGVGATKLFQLLATEGGDELEEEEQVNLLSLPLMRLMLSLQEVVLLGLYAYQPRVEALCERFRDALLRLEAHLRAKVYLKQRKQMQTKGQAEIERHASATAVSRLDFQRFQQLKRAEFERQSRQRELCEEFRIAQRVGRETFHKLPFLKQTLLKEKLLAIEGNPQEARACAEKYVKMRVKEQRAVEKNVRDLRALQRGKLHSKERIERNCLEDRLAFNRELLEKRENNELVRMKRRQETLRGLVYRIQHVNGARATKDIASSYRHSLVKAYAALARDIKDRLRDENSPTSSLAFQSISSPHPHSLLTAAEPAQVELLRGLKAAPLLPRPEFKIVRDDYVRVNVREEKFSGAYDKRKIGALLGAETPCTVQQPLRLAQLYDDNLELIPARVTVPPTSYKR